jgi:predicted ArsR family transcriptional regulator
MTMSAIQEQARALGDPTRYRIFRYLVEAGGPVRVAQLTREFGLNHNAIRQHLARLVAADLATESTEHRAGRGRPPLLYRVAAGAESRWGVVGPYERLSALLAEVIRAGEPAVEVGRRSGRTRAERMPAGQRGLDRLIEVMEQDGFAPDVHDAGDDRTAIVLRRCPFESTALADPVTVCALHLGLAQGLTEHSDVSVVGLVPGDPAHPDCRLQLAFVPTLNAGTTGSSAPSAAQSRPGGSTRGHT